MSHFLALATSMLILAGCAHTAHNTIPSPTVIIPEAPEPVLIKEQLPPQDLRQDELLAMSSDFRETLIEWLHKHPRATHGTLAREAQKMISTHGLLFLANIKDLPERDRKYRMLRIAGNQTLLFDTSGAVPGPCGEFFIYLSVTDLNGGAPVILTNQGPVALPLNTPGLYFEQTLLSTEEQPTPQPLLSPTPDGPWNVEPRAKYIVWKYDLKMSIMENWWVRLARRYRELREERPFLAIRISSEGFIVETYDRGLLPGQYDQVVSEKKGVVRRMYKPGSVRVDVADSCEQASEN